MSSPLRLSLLAVAAIAAVPALSACDTSPGAAAIVGSDQVSTAHLQSEVNTSLADPAVQSALANPQFSQALGVNRVGFTRQTLSRLIGEDVVSKVAAAHHVTVSPAEITAQTNDFIQQAGSLTALQESAAEQVGVGAKGLTSLIRFTVLQQKLGTALTATLPATQAQLETEYQKDIDQYDQLQIAQIAVQSKKLANRLLTQVRHDPSSFASLARANSLDSTSKASGGLVGFVPRSQVISLLGSAAKAKVGSFVLAHPPSSSASQAPSQWIVLHIIKRQVTPLRDVVDQVKAALFAAQSNTLLATAITREATQLGVHINPRYGTWNNATQSVVATKSPISSTG
jgi:parvulin-like peptidyl-prolyl isomerase